MATAQGLYDIFGEAPYRMLVETIRDFAIFHLDLEGRIVSWNEGATIIFGYAESEAIGQGLALLFTPEDRASGVPERELKKAVREGRAEDARWHLRKDGSRVFINGVTTVLRDGQGDLRGFAKVGRDDTAREQAEEALHESERQLRTLADAVPQLVWMAEPDGDAVAPVGG